MPDARVPAALTWGSNGSGSPSPTRGSPHSLGGIRGKDLNAILQFQIAALAEQRGEDQRDREDARRASWAFEPDPDAAHKIC